MLLWFGEPGVVGFDGGGKVEGREDVVIGLRGEREGGGEAL